MNDAHLQRLASTEWRQYLDSELLPWVLDNVTLGHDVLEIGPGPGLTTELLHGRVDRLTAVEVDVELAAALRARFQGSNVEVVTADATRTDLPSNRFTAATCFTMLHHIPTPALQDDLFVEVHRVLRAGGTFVGTDALDTVALRELHVDDVYVPVDPDTLGGRLEDAGFVEVDVARWRSVSPITGQLGERVRFSCSRPRR